MTKPRVDPAVWRIAVVVGLGSGMGMLNTTIVNVALQSIAKSLGTGLDEVQWVATGYLLSLAATLPVSGWVARRLGARRTYLWALLLFTGGSALCGLAWSPESLLAFRVLQALGGGLMLPVGHMILARAAGRAHLPRVMAVTGAAAIVAPIFGPTVGGLLIEHAGWQWIFLVNVPLGAIALALALRRLPHDVPADAGRVDLAGLMLLVPGVVAITFGLAEAGQVGALDAAQVVLPLVAGIGLVVAFVRHAWRLPRPLLDVRLWSNRAFAAAGTASVALGAALFGSMILMPLYFQLVRDQDVVATGLLLIPQGVGAAVAMRLSAGLTERVGGGATAFAGTLIALVTTLPFALIGAETSFWLLGAAMALRGFGVGMSTMPAWTAAFSALGPEQVNDASPQLTVLQQVGGSLGIALLSVILERHLHGAATSGAEAAAFRHTYWWVMGMSLAATLSCALLWRIERHAHSAGRRTPEIPALPET